MQIGTGQDALEPVQGEPVHILADRDVGQKPWAGVALGDRLGRHRGQDRCGLAVAADIALADMTQHLDAGRDQIELFAGFFTDDLERAATGAVALILG